MASEKSLFNDIDKIKYVDLADELQGKLDKGLITEDDRRKLDSLTSEGAAGKLANDIKFQLGDSPEDLITFNGEESVTVEITPETIGAATGDHDHDDVYSKLGHDHNYAGADTPGGSANSAKKLDNTININISGAITGSGSTDGTTDVEIKTSVNHDHNYAGADTPGGSANSAKKLEKPININIKGSAVGEATTDGSKDINIELIQNHEHAEYAMVDHDHDKEYASKTHIHYYAGSEEPSGAANSAKKLDAPLKINVTGSESGSVSFSGNEKEVQLQLNVTHTHSMEDLNGFENGVKNPEALTIKYNHEVQNVYDGSEPIELDIKPAVIQVVDDSKLPTVGDPYTTYVNTTTGVSKVFNKTTGGYLEVGFGLSSVAIIDGNLN